MIKKTSFSGIYKEETQKGMQLFTRNLAPGHKVYDEFLVEDNGIEYRSWNPHKSKLAAAIHNKIAQTGIKTGQSLLYLGAASGTTVSHVSDIIGPEGQLFAVEISPTVMRDLVFMSEQRSNIAPILADASKPESYFHRVFQVDTVYQDIAQRSQVEILMRNVSLLLKPGGNIVLAVKARSIDVTANPKAVFEHAREELEKRIKIADWKLLEPFEKDHMLVVGRL